MPFFLDFQFSQVPNPDAVVRHGNISYFTAAAKKKVSPDSQAVTWPAIR